MKIKTTLIATLLATAFGSTAVQAASMDVYATSVNGSIRHLDITPENDVSLVMHVKTQKANGKKFSKTLQFTDHYASFESILSGVETSSIPYEVLDVKVRANGGREFAESFELPFELPNETYKHAEDASVGSAAIFSKSVTDANGNKYKTPVLYVNINGKFVPAQNAELSLPNFIKGNGKHLFKAVPTDIVGNVIVGFIEAKEHINFSKEGYYFADGERIPVYWTFSPNSSSSCNSACKQQSEAHMSVKQAKVLGKYKKMSNIKAKDENGELLDWIEFTSVNGTLQGLGDTPYGLVRDENYPDTYWVYGSAIAKDESEVKTPEATYYSKDDKVSPAMAIRLVP